jgi:hypothetical protein
MTCTYQVEMKTLGVIVLGLASTPALLGFFLVRVAQGSRATVEFTSISDGVWVPDELQVFASAGLGLLQTLSIEQRVRHSQYSVPADARTNYPEESRDARSAALNRFAKAISP